MISEPTRRAVLQAGAALVTPLPAATTQTYAYVGCYTTAERHGRGDGIHAYRVDARGASGVDAYSRVSTRIVSIPFAIDTYADQIFFDRVAAAGQLPFGYKGQELA